MTKNTNLSRSIVKTILFTAAFIFANLSYSAYYWQITSISSIDSGGTYCQNSNAKPIHLAVIQCAGGGSKPHNSTSVTLSWYRSKSNTNSGGTLVDQSPYYTQHLFGYDITYAPSTADTGTFYYYAVISSPSMTSCGFTDSLVSNTVAVSITPAEPSGFRYSDRIFCSGSSNPTPVLSGSNGGTYSSSSLVNIDANTGSFNVNAQSSGTHIIQYNVSGTCPGQSTDTIEIIDRPDSNIYIEGFTIKAVDSGSTYTWKKCSDNSIIPNQDSSSFTPSQNGMYYVLISRGACEVKSNCIEFKLLSIESVKRNSIKVYPNPAENNLQIETTGDLSKYRIMDMSGKILSEDSLPANAVIDIQSLQSGLYIIQFDNGSQSLFQKR